MEQPGVSDHAGFMNGLAEEGIVLLAGPLAETERGRFRALLIFDAETEAEIKHRLADDPCACAKRLQVTQIEPWTILVGAERLKSGHAASGAAA
jgi:uncharacterized protein YciI